MSSRDSVQKVAVGVEHAHSGVWVNSIKPEELWNSIMAPAILPLRSEYVQAKLVGLAGLANSCSPPVHRYLATRLDNEWPFE